MVDTKKKSTAGEGGEDIHPWKKDKDRRKGKGQRFCLRDRIFKIPCRASYFALGRFRIIG